jgi:hypothetical protein
MPRQARTPPSGFHPGSAETGVRCHASWARSEGPVAASGGLGSIGTARTSGSPGGYPMRENRAAAAARADFPESRSFA